MEGIAMSGCRWRLLLCWPHCGLFRQVTDTCSLVPRFLRFCWISCNNSCFLHVAGLRLWKRNLQLLVPFLIQPSVRMLEIRRTSDPQEEAAVTLRVSMRLEK